MNDFIVLEIIDPQINALFSAIWNATSGVQKPKRAHVTLRGPYKDEVPKEQIALCRKLLKYDVLVINGIGKFSNNDEHVVYIKVSSPNLRQTWWKPDYPIHEFGFEPHISLYRGKSEELAENIKSILEKEKIDLRCAEHRIIVNKVHDFDLFKMEYRVGGNYDMLIENKKISKKLIIEIEDAVKRSKSNK